LRGRRVFEPADRLALGDEHEMGTQRTSGAFKGLRLCSSQHIENKLVMRKADFGLHIVPLPIV
jgi:hypothetical protein